MRRENGNFDILASSIGLCTFKEFVYSHIEPVEIDSMFKSKRRRANVRKATKGSL